MSRQVNLEMSHYTYQELCDAVERAAEHSKSFDDIRDLVHLVDFLEEEHERDNRKQNLDYQTWKLHEELFRNKEIYHHQYFNNVSRVFEDYEDRELLKWCL